MNRLIIALVAVLSLGVVSVQADKPKWAGEGGKPSEQEKQEHVDTMRDKHGNKDPKKNKDHKMKKAKEGEDSDWEKARKDLEDNVRSHNRGKIGERPLD